MLRSRLVVPELAFVPRGTGNDAEGNRRAEDFNVMVVDLVFEASGSGLIETVELVEIDGVAIRHQQPMEGDGEALLAKPETFWTSPE